MFDGSPSFALKENDERSRLSQAESLRLEAVNGIRKLRLQVRPHAGIDPGRLEELLGIALPADPLEKTGEAPSAYWLAPDDWLLINPATDADSIKIALRDTVDGATAVVTDMTDAWSIIDISGEDAVARLAGGCSVDIHASVFPAGRYALTRLQHLSVIIHRLDDTPRFRILVDRSVARFLWDWLAV